MLEISNIHEVLEDFPDYRVLSIGCGPATEFFGILANMERLQADKPLRFMGLDFNDVWRSIHRQIENEIVPTLDDVRVRFRYVDGVDFFRDYALGENPPNVLVLQYVLSDIQGHGGNVTEFLNLIVRNVVPTMPVGSVIIINDINHFNPRDHFDELATLLNGSHSVARYHFENNNREAYRYGNRHADNDVLYPIPRDVRVNFNPWAFCASAQMVLKKRA